MGATLHCSAWHSVVVQVSSVQSITHVRLFATPWTTTRQTSLSITNSQSLLRLMSIELMMPSNHLILYRPLLLLPSVFLSIGVFSNESVLRIRWLKYWSFGFSISPSNEYSGLISFRVDWLDLLSVRGTLKSLFQHYSFWCGPFLKSLLNLLQYCFCFYALIFFDHKACGILAPQPGFCIGRQSPTTGLLKSLSIASGEHL